MFTRAVFIGAAVLAVGISELAAQAVGPETIRALRQMAIEAGQTSSSADKLPAKSREAIEAERQSIESHRADFFARAYSAESYAEAERKSGAGQTASTLLLIPAQAVQLVDRGTVLALRQMAIEAGQTSSSADKPPAKSREAIEAERSSIKAHRADFFARAYGDEPGV